MITTRDVLDLAIAMFGKTAEVTVRTKLGRKRHWMEATPDGPEQTMFSAEVTYVAAREDGARGQTIVGCLGVDTEEQAIRTLYDALLLHIAVHRGPVSAAEVAA